MRILYYAINGTGLGHLARLSNVATAVRALDPEVHQLVVTNSSYLEMLKRQGLPFAVIPSSDAEPFVGLDRRRRSVTRRTAYAMLYRLIGEYDPALVVFDTHAPPQLVRRLAEERRPMALVLRRVRDSYLTTLLDDGLLSHFAAVLVPHAREEFSAGLSDELARKLQSLPHVSFVGPIVRSATTEARAAIAARYQVDPSRRLVVITCGSGGYVHQSAALIRKSAAAAMTLRERDPSVDIVVVGGPHGAAVSVPGCRWVESEPELPALFACAHLVVTHGGYNSVHEVLQAGARAVFVPLHRQNESQAERVLALRDAGRAHVADIDAEAGEFAATLRAAFDSPPPRASRFDGGAEAARALHALLPVPERLALAGSLPIPRGWQRVEEAPLSMRLATPAPRALLVDDQSLARLLAGSPAVALAVTSWFVALDDADSPSLLARATAALARLVAAGVDANAVSIVFSDRKDGATLVDLAGALAAALTGAQSGPPPRALIACMPRCGDDAARFQALESCRNAGLPFKVDLTSIDDPVLLVDQP